MSDEENILDDADLLKDRLLRSLHRDSNGHLSSDRKKHKTDVEKSHNVAVLFIYAQADDAVGMFTLHERYLYSDRPLNYWSWRRIVHDECRRTASTWGNNLLGIFGWFTASIQVTPLREGDLFIKVDDAGATGVRIAFSARKSVHETRSKKSKR